MYSVALTRRDTRFISHFRAPEKMNTEAGYYYTHLFSAITFIEILDAKSISIDPAEFERLMRTPAKPAASAPTVIPSAAAGAALATSPASLGYMPLSVSTAPPPPSDLISFDAVPVSASPVSSPVPARSTPTQPAPSVSPRARAAAPPPSASPAPPSVAQPAPSPSPASVAPTASLVPSLLAAAPAPSVPILRTSSSVSTPPASPQLSVVDFATATEADLKMEHIPLLLDAYKQLLSENKGLRMLLQEHGIMK